MMSGGIDSAMLAALLKKQGHEVLPVHVNYGQLAEEREWSSCLQACSHLKLPDPLRIDLSGMKKIPSGLTNKNLDIEKAAFLPTRNLVFLVAGAAYAYSRSVNVVAIGLLANPIFPDQTPDFVRSAETCLSNALGYKVRVLTPFITLDKRDILKLAKKESFPLGLCYYCHSGGTVPCGVCISCKERIAAEESLRQEEAGESNSEEGAKEGVSKTGP